MKALPELENAILRIKAKYLRQVEKALTDPTPTYYVRDYNEDTVCRIHDIVSTCKKEINLLKAKTEARNVQSLRDTELNALLREREDADKIWK